MMYGRQTSSKAGARAARFAERRPLMMLLGGGSLIALALIGFSDSARGQDQTKDQGNSDAPVAHVVQKGSQTPGANGAADAANADQLATQGSDLYTNEGCVSCHGQDGKGRTGVAPALAGSKALSDAQHVISQILIGRGSMPTFAHKLNDQQIAALSTYIRTSWGNGFGKVTTSQVHDIRQSAEVQNALGQMSARASTGQTNPGKTGAAPGEQPAKAPSSADTVQTSEVKPPPPPGAVDVDIFASKAMAGALVHVPVTNVFPGDIPVKPKVTDPVANDPEAAYRGMTYFNQFNCVGCHAANGAGGMGPSLSNSKFVYGSEPEQIYLTILQGRPAGMPAWGGMLPDQVIWDLVAYIRSISKEPSGEWGKTTSLDTMGPEQVPYEYQKTVNPWNYTEPFSYGQAPFKKVEKPSK